MVRKSSGSLDGTNGGLRSVMEDREVMRYQLKEFASRMKGGKQYVSLDLSRYFV